MNLSQTLADEFARSTKDDSPKQKEYTVFGTVASVGEDGIIDVLIDGAEITTPCTSSVVCRKNDRVVVSVKNRQPTITSDITRKAIDSSFLELGTTRFRGHIDILDVDEERWAGGVICRIGDRWTYGSEIMIETEDHNFYVSINPEYVTVGQYPGTNDYASLSPSGVYKPSDRRIKEDIKDIDDPERLLRLRPVSFYYTNGKRDYPKYGFIAQEVQEVYPEFVFKKTDGLLGLCYENFVVPAIAMIQKLDKRVSELENEIAILKGEINELKNNRLPTEE